MNSRASSALPDGECTIPALGVFGVVRGLFGEPASVEGDNIWSSSFRMSRGSMISEMRLSVRPGTGVVMAESGEDLGCSVPSAGEGGFSALLDVPEGAGTVLSVYGKVGVNGLVWGVRTVNEWLVRRLLAELVDLLDLRVDCV